MKRSVVIVLLLCAGVLGAAAVVYALVFRDVRRTAVVSRPHASPRQPGQPSDPSGGSAFELVDVTGTVEVKRGGTWIPIGEGADVQANESIRTARGGRAVLRSPSGDELLLRERVELTVGELSSTVTELTLLRGRVKAAAGAGTERLQISAKGARAVGPSGSRFTVYSDTRGAVAVASDQGDVKVIAKGETVTVGTGMQTQVSPGEAPRAPTAVAAEVFLAVAWPAGEVHETRTVLRGKTTPGAEVTVNGEQANVMDDGRFEVSVPLKRGKNNLEVTAEGVDGKTRETTGSVTVDAPAASDTKVDGPNVGHFPPPVKAP